MWSQPFWSEQTPGSFGASVAMARAASSVSRAFTQRNASEAGASTEGSRSATSPCGGSLMSAARRSSERESTRTACPARASFNASREPSAPAPTTPTVSATPPPLVSARVDSRTILRRMSHRPPRAVIFDYGNTLVSVDPALYSQRTDYADVVAIPGTERIARYLVERGRLTQDQGTTFIDRFRSTREANRKRADETGDEIAADVSLKATFRALGMAEPDRNEVEEILKVFFSVEEGMLQEIPGAGRTLEHLAERGIPMALLSNATDGAYIARVVERMGWTRYFHPFVVSSDIGVRKPRPEAFQPVLRDWTFAPQEIAMVGDSLRHDVGGAQALGLRT